jgi:hypothetical protein
MRRLPGCMAGTNLQFAKWWRTKKKFVLVFLLHRKLLNCYCYFYSAW